MFLERTVWFEKIPKYEFGKIIGNREQRFYRNFTSMIKVKLLEIKTSFRISYFADWEFFPDRTEPC